MNLDNLLNGCNFQKAADVVVCRDWPRSHSEQPFESIKNKREYFDKAIIFCDSYYLPELFREIKDHSNNYILISHLRDISINKNIFDAKPKCIKKWFAQNADYEHEDLIPIPIGIENHAGAWKGTLIDLDFWSKYNLNDTYEKNKDLCVNFSGAGSAFFSHHSRQDWLEHLTQEGFEISPRLSSVENLNNVKNHYLCASPRGNGIDCHRTWEALYFDCVPIVPKHLMYNHFATSIIQVENEKLINKKLINYLIDEYKSNKLKFDKQILDIDYWINKIKIQQSLL